MKRKRDRGWLIAILGIVAGFLLGLWVGSQFIPALGGADISKMSGEQRDDYVTLVAVDYAQTGDLVQARSRLEPLKAPNLAFLVVGVAERAIEAGGDQEEIGALAQLGSALGAQNSVLVAYIPTPTEDVFPTATPAPTTPAPPAPTPASASPTATPAPPTPTSAPPTATPAPPTATPTPEPAVISETAINVRGGPGTNYPIVAGLEAGESAAILGRNPKGSWWQIRLNDGTEGWVLGQIVQTEGDVAAIAVAANIPTPPPTPTPAAPPTPTPAPTPSEAYSVFVRLRPLNDGAQGCTGGDHYIRVVVKDAAGNPINGMQVREVFTGQVNVTGAQGKGDGAVQFDIYKDGGGQVELLDSAGNRVGPVSRGMSANWPPFDLLQAAGYCSCKPHPDAASCQADLENKQYLFALGHYVYEVTYTRNY